MVQLLDGCGRMLLAWGRKVEVEEGGGRGGGGGNGEEEDGGEWGGKSY